MRGFEILINIVERVPIMLNGDFNGLWNRAVLIMGALWAVLVFMIWETNQLETAGDRQVFLTVVIGGFLVVYQIGRASCRERV